MAASKKAAAGSELKVYLFNVGQGDHLLLELPDGEFGVIDFYYEAPLKEPPALTHLKYLKEELGREVVISFVCITHPDSDHIKGVAKFFGWVGEHGITVRSLWMFAGTDFDELMSNLRDAFERMKSKTAAKSKEVFEALLQRAEAYAGRLTSVDDFLRSWRGDPDYIQACSLISDHVGGEIEVISIAPLGKHIKTFDRQTQSDLVRMLSKNGTKPSARRNLVSSVLLMKFRGLKLLFGGDTGERIWDESLKHYVESGNERQYGKCEGDFIKVSHHGSKHSSSERLWGQILRPRSRLGISAGKGKKHPHQETVVSILETAAQSGRTADVTTTNACDACLHNARLGNEHIGGFPTVLPSYAPQEDEALRRVRPPKGKGELPAPRFLAHIFSLDSGGVRASTAVTDAPGAGAKCLFGKTNPKEYFPQCALPPPKTPLAAGGVRLSRRTRKLGMAAKVARHG